MLRHRAIPPGRFAFAVLACALLAWAMPASAEFTVRTWTIEEGLPTSTVEDIEQTPDGALWVATTGGLARFDGLRFESFGPEQGLPSNRFAALAVAPDGTLCATSEDGSLVCWDGHRFAVTPTGLTRPTRSLHALPDGSLIANSAGIAWRYARGQVRRLAAPIDWRSSPVVDRRGVVWLSAPDLQPARLDGDRVVVLGPPGRSERDRWVLDQRTGHALYFRSLGADAELLDAGLRRVVLLRGAGGETPYQIDRNGRLWLASAPDLVLRAVESGAVVTRIGLALPGPPQRLFVDRDANVWVGTLSQGLVRVSPSPLELLRPVGREAPTEIFTVRELREGVIGADEKANLWLPRGGVLVPSADRTPAGWPNTWQGDGRTSYRMWLHGIDVADDRGHHVTTALPEEYPLGLNFDPRVAGVVYVNTEYQLLRISAVPGTPTVQRLLPPGTMIRHVHFDRAGAMWVATLSGLWRILPGDTVRFTVRDGLPTDHFRQIHERPDGTLWIGTYGGGLVRWRGGRFATLGRAQGLLENVVSVVLEDDRGHLWLGGNRGIQRLSLEQADACLDGRRRRVEPLGFGPESGLRNPEGSGQPGLRSRDGRLWFPMLDGVAVVDPRRERRVTPPTPSIEAVVVGDHAAARSGDRFVLAPSERRFTVRYSGIDVTAAERVRFRYRLRGVDAGWIDASESRAATYTQAPPGRLVFEVVASGADGASTGIPATVVLDLRPHFWETWPFRIAALAALVALFAWASRLRTRRLVARAAALERAVDERTAELVTEKGRTESALATVEAQAQRLAALDQARSRFFASISHEFRTPLTLIHGPLQDVREGLHGEVPPEAAEQVGIALDHSARLQRLVDQLLDATRAEAGVLRIERRSGDLGVFLDALAQGFAPLAERKRITFTREIAHRAMPASFDPLALEKVVANLLGNAFKFTPESGHVVLRLAPVGSPAGPLAEISVTDDGPGISPHDLPRVFERFYRAESSITRVQPGTGLGLALARDMVELHEGTIHAESNEGSGARFVVRLPLEAASTDVRTSEPVRVDIAALADEIRVGVEPEPAAEAGPGPGEDASLVLLVEDHPDVRAHVARHLRRRYRVLEAAEGARALEEMRRTTPDLVVSDIAMPVMDGLALVQAMRADPELEFVPVVLLTAAASTESRIRGFEGGTDDYLTKPFEVRELLARIERLLHSRRRLKEKLTRAAAEAAIYCTVARHMRVTAGAQVRGLPRSWATG